MSLTEKQKQWVGALASLVVQYSFFITLSHYAGDFISAILAVLLNIGIACGYKSKNPYFTGVRWATFLALGAMTVIRHEYWYATTLENFIRLRDLYVPLEWNEMLCQGAPEDILMIGSTGVLIVIFYSIVMRWDDWTGRWEMLRRALFSSSLGLQTLIAVAVIYPTPLTLILALFFASLVSPILRRQVRLNHVVFLILPPMFALSVSGLSIWVVTVSAILFFVFYAVERSKTTGMASFTFFCAIAFMSLSITYWENFFLGKVVSRLAAGTILLVTFLVMISIIYVLLFRGEQFTILVRRAVFFFIPKRVQESKWWAVRDLWVDREVDHRVNKRYNMKDLKPSLGLFFFGPKEWVENTEEYERKDYSRVNLVPSITIMMLFAIYPLIDLILIWFDFDQPVRSVASFFVGLFVILSVPVILVIKIRKDKAFYRLPSLLTAVTGAGIVLFLFGSVFYFGLNTDRRLDDSPAPAATTTTTTTEEEVPYDCPCKGDPIRLSNYL